MLAIRARYKRSSAPKYANENDWSWTRDNDQRVYDYYKVTPYWLAAS